jgi:1,4-dihydroxy-2-naphthoate octaprenyltransferase
LCLVPTNDIAATVNASGNDDDGNDRGHCDTLDGYAAPRGYDPLMTFVVLSSMFNAVAYTGGPFPLGYVGLGELSIGYSGLGDIFVFLYFGIVATMGVPYLYLVRSLPAAVAASSSSACMQSSSNALATTTTTTTDGGGDGVILLWNMLRPSLLHSLPVGFLATAIIVVNNLRDRHTDVHARKRTLAVRCGEKFARMEYFVLVLGSYAFCVIYYCYSCWWSSSTTTITTSGPMTTMAWTSLLPLLSFPAALPQLRAVAFGGKDGMALNDHVGGTARLQMMYCVLMAIGLAISSW